MKITTYFMKLCGASLIAISGLVMFIHGIAANFTTVSDIFWGLAVTSAGVVLLAYVIETNKCPIKLTISKAEQKAPVADTAPTADTATMPAIQTAEAQANTAEASVEAEANE